MTKLSTNEFMSQALLDSLIQPFGNFKDNGITIVNPQTNLDITLYTTPKYRKYYKWRYNNVVLNATNPQLSIFDIENIKLINSNRIFINLNTTNIDEVIEILNQYWEELYQEKYSGRIIFNHFTNSYWLYTFIKSVTNVMTIELLLEKIIDNNQIETHEYLTEINLRIT